MTNVLVNTPKLQPAIFVNRRAYRRLHNKRSCTFISPANLLFDVNGSGDLQSGIDLGCETRIIETKPNNRWYLIDPPTTTGYVYYAELRSFASLTRANIHCAGFRTKAHFVQDWDSRNAETHKSKYNPVVAVLHIMCRNAFTPTRKPWIIPIDEYPGVWLLPVHDWFPAFLDDDDIGDMHGVLSEVSCANCNKEHDHE